MGVGICPTKVSMWFGGGGAIEAPSEGEGHRGWGQYSIVGKCGSAGKARWLGSLSLWGVSVAWDGWSHCTKRWITE